MEPWRELRVWKHAHDLVLCVYKVTKRFPHEERYGLTSQLQRATVSVAANIVEGTKRMTAKDQQRFLMMANTSLEEAKYYFILGLHLNYISEENATELTKKARNIGRMISGMITRYNVKK